MNHTDEFWHKIERTKALLAAAPPLANNDRFVSVTLAIQEFLASPVMLRAGQILFEDYATVRMCARAMLKILSRKLC